MAIFELFMITVSSKARSVMKIDIVKPIPAKNPAPIMFFHFKSVGNMQSPTPTPINEKSQTPKGFPITSPAIIPKLFDCPNPFCQSPLISNKLLLLQPREQLTNQITQAV